MAPRFGSAVLVLLIVSALPATLSITTTHHDKPEAAKIPVIVAQMKPTRKPLQVNRTLEVSERQKRLLPYMTFYMEHDFNRPQQHTHRPLKPTFQQFQNKFNELTGINYVPKYQDQTSQKTNPTPFSESNALPGPFVPMRNSYPQEPPQPTKVTYTQQYQTTKLPNYSAIYDKLSQLKLQQQQYNQLVQTYSNYNQPYYVRKPQEVNFVPAKTVVQTYNPESIDVPTANHYQPLRTYTDQHLNLYQQEIHAPHLDHVQPVTEEEQQQYIEDQKYTIGVKKQPTKPIILLRQKTRLIPQKPVVIVQRKPIQKPYTFEVQPGKYETVRVRYENLPKFELTSNYKTITNPESYDVEPKYIRLIPKPTYVTVTPKYVQPDQGRYNEPQVLSYQAPKVQAPVYQESYEEPTQPPYEEPPVTSFQEEPKPTRQPPSYQEPTASYAPAYIAPVTDYSTPVQTKIPVDDSNSLSVILKKLQDTNALPQTLTPDNIDNSIRTLVKILSNLKKQQRFMRPIVVPDEYEEDIDNEAGVELGETPGAVGPVGAIADLYPENTPEGGTPGKAGVDYPALSTIPQTSFNCKTQRYKGFFGDPDTNCQVWHYCDLNGGQASFLCPNGTIFSQVALTCDWWYNVKCANTPQQYVLNERLYKYILPLAPKFPEDYSGPLVDRYLAMKFQEMEEKMKKERKKNKENSSDEGAETSETGDDADELSREEQKKQTAMSLAASAEEQNSTEK